MKGLGYHFNAHLLLQVPSQKFWPSGPLFSCYPSVGCLSLLQGTKLSMLQFWNSAAYCNKSFWLISTDDLAALPCWVEMNFTDILADFEALWGCSPTDWVPLGKRIQMVLLPDAAPEVRALSTNAIKGIGPFPSQPRRFEVSLTKLQRASSYLEGDVRWGWKRDSGEGEWVRGGKESRWGNAYCSITGDVLIGARRKVSVSQSS